VTSAVRQSFKQEAEYSTSNLLFSLTYYLVESLTFIQNANVKNLTLAQITSSKELWDRLMADLSQLTSLTIKKAYDEHNNASSYTCLRLSQMPDLERLLLDGDNSTDLLPILEGLSRCQKLHLLFLERFQVKQPELDLITELLSKTELINLHFIAHNSADMTHFCKTVENHTTLKVLLISVPSSPPSLFQMIRNNLSIKILNLCNFDPSWFVSLEDCIQRNVLLDEIILHLDVEDISFLSSFDSNHLLGFQTKKQEWLSHGLVFDYIRNKDWRAGLEEECKNLLRVGRALSLFDVAWELRLMILEKLALRLEATAYFDEMIPFLLDLSSLKWRKEKEFPFLDPSHSKWIDGFLWKKSGINY
jgi:hypothetical protein